MFGTSDGGITWTCLDTLPSDEHISGLHFVDQHMGWIAGYRVFSLPLRSQIFYTADGGHTWSLQFEEEGLFFSDICFTDAEHGWALDRLGGILKYVVP